MLFRGVKLKDKFVWGTEIRGKYCYVLNIYTANIEGYPEVERD